MASIGDLQVDLRLASAKFEQGLKDVNNKLSSFGDEVAKAKGAAVGLAGALAIGGFGAWIKGSIDAADAAAKTSQSIGITVEALTGLQFAADLAGVSSKNLDTGLKNLNKSIYDAYKGAASQSEAFKILGVSVTDANGNLKDSNSVLLEVADKFATFADGADKTALSMQLFGKSGKDMIPLLNGGASSITELTDRAKKLGVVIDGETAAASEHFNDNLSLLSAIAQGSANSLAVQLLPALNDITDAMITFSENSAAATTASTALGGALKVLLATGTVVADSFMAAGEMIGASAAAISAAAQGEFEIAKRIFNDTTLGDKLKRDGKALEQLFNGSADATKKAEKTLLAIQKTVDTLRLESDVIGMTANEVTLYKLALEGATQAQLDSVATSQFIIQSHKDRVTALDELIKAEDAYNQNKASAQSGLDSTTAGLQTAGESIDAQYEARLSAISTARSFELQTAISYDELELRAAMSREEQITAIEEAEAQKRKAIQDAVNQSRLTALDELIKAEDAYNQNKASAQSGLDSTTAGLQTAGESIDAQYEARLSAISTARSFELQTAISYDELELRAAMSREEQITAIEEAEAQKRKAIQDAVNQSRLSATATMFGNLAALMNTKSKKLFEIGKAAAIAETAINTGRAAMGAYAALSGIPFVGPGLAVAAAAAAVAAGAAQIQQISSQQFGGGGSVSFSGSAPGVYNPPQPTVPYGSQSTGEKSGREVNLIFNGPINGYDIAGLAEQLGNYINQSDTIFIDGSSRTGLQFATAF